MFKILPIQSPEAQIECAHKCNTEYKEGAFAYSMIDAKSGELMGFSQFEITENGGILLDLRPSDAYSEDYEAMFILGRATMNFIDLWGKHTLSAAESSGDITLLRAISLKPQENGTLFCDMTGFFDGSHCSGH
jgi:hypothetical protein